MIRSILLLAALAASMVEPAAGTVTAQKDKRPPVPAALQAKIGNAIDLGIESLLARQSLDGSWTQQIEGYGTGATGLVLYALMKSGLSPDHPAVARGFAALRGTVPTKTYSRACVMFAVTTRGLASDAEWIDELTQSLVRSQSSQGWGYPGGEPDLSNTQYAVMALRAAEAAGAKIPTRTWSKLADTALSYLEAEEGSVKSGYAPRGFKYRPSNPDTTGSMTSAGVAILTIALDHVRVKKGSYARALEQGKAWLGEHFSVARNPVPARDGAHGHYYYYLYGLERVGSLLEVEMLGDHPWYQLGAEALVAKQADDGSWGGQASTAFGLLFLARATGSLGPSSGGPGGPRTSRWTFGADDPKQDVSLRGSGRKTTTLWVSSFGDNAIFRHGTGEEGDGPLAVVRVEYWVLADAPDHDAELIASVDVEDPLKAAAKGAQDRYAVQSDLPGPRVSKVFARVFLADEDTPLESKPIVVRVGVTERETWADYATDHERNLLRDVRIQVTTSSASEGPRSRPRNLIDGYIGLGWKPAKDDSDPWAQLDLSKPVRTNTILLSHAELGGPLFGRFEIVINDRAKSRIESEMVADVREKTVLTLPKSVRIRTLRIRFVGDASTGKGANPPGLGEIELQLRR